MPNRSNRAPTSSNKTDWYAHIRSLGLSSVAEYEAWCRRHGLPFHRRKTWRQERQERQIAERERGDERVRRHIEALGLESAEAYLSWCEAHGFRPTTAKSAGKMHREIQYQRSPQRKRAMAVSTSGDGAPVPTVTGEHLAQLGLTFTDSYAGWCRRHGLNPAMVKSPRELQDEVALATLAQAKAQRLGARSLIERIHAGRIGVEELKTVVLRRIHAGFATLQAAEMNSCLRLLLHAECCSELLSTAMGALRWGRRSGNSFVEGLLALARHGDRWIRPVEGWRPESRIHYEQFASLARHLVCEYEVPGFMDSVWFLEDREQTRRQQRWFIHLGMGGNIRTADVPLRLSKRMAHEFGRAPEHYTVEEALRYGQVKGQGGSDAIAEAILATHLGRSFDHDEFWSKVVTFFVLHGELDLKWVASIVAYIHHRKFEPLGGGEPAEPNFSMKSRSVPKLIGQVERWQKHWTREARQTLRQRSSDTARIRYKPYHAEETDKWGNTLHWMIDELTTPGALAAEGEAMNHCVGRFASRLDQLSIWSLKVQEESRVYHVLTISIDTKEGYVSEIRGRFNLSAQPGGVNRGRSKEKLSRREHRYLGGAYDHLQAWLAREGLADVQIAEGDEAERREFWDWHRWQSRIGVADAALPDA